MKVVWLDCDGDKLNIANVWNINVVGFGMRYLKFFFPPQGDPKWASMKNEFTNSL